MDTRRDFIFVDDLVDVVMQAVVEGVGPRPLPRLDGLGLRDQGAVRRDDRTRWASSSRRTSRSGRGERTTPTRSCSTPPASRADFGWDVTIPLEEGVARAIEYYREFGISETYTHLRVGE